jgi:TM2 domain-containing membrane protein YozV
MKKASMILFLLFFGMTIKGSHKPQLLLPMYIPANGKC